MTEDAESDTVGSSESVQRIYREALSEGERTPGTEELLWELVQGAPGAFIVLDTDRRVRLWDRRAEEMFGWTESEVLGREPPIVPEDRRDAFRELCEEIFAGKAVRGRDVRRERKDGTAIDCAVWAKPLEGPDGEPVGLRAVCLDVSDRKAAERHGELFTDNVAGVARLTLDGELLDCNRAFARIFGYDSIDEALAHPPDAYFPDDLELGQDEAGRRLREEGEIRNQEVRRLRKDGSEIRLLLNARVTDDPEPVVLATMIDVTERREARKRYEELFEHNVAGVFRSTPEGTILECNRALVDMLGYDSPEELEGRDARILYPSSENREHYMERLLEQGEVENEELELRSRDGSPVWVLENSFLSEDPATGEPVIQGTMVDITSRKRAEERLEEMAYRDPLTGLGNRRMLSDQANRFFSLAERRDHYVGLAYLDLDRFKEVNDLWGHEIGDEVLQEVADRLQAQSRQADLVARVGGDEFVVLLADVDTPEEVLTGARRLTSTFDAPVSLDEEQVVSVDVSVGVSVFPVDGEELDGLLRRSDRALHRAKERGGRIARYQPETDVSLAEASELDREIREGLEAGDFELHYQPIVRLPDCAPTAVEALVRWNHPDRGLLEASDFVPRAERSGLIREIDKWVVERAARQLARWQEDGSGPETVSVNLSALSFRDPAVLRRTSAVLQEEELRDRGGLIVEITETEAMQDPAMTIELLRGFRDTGIRVALDDFGTGHSSLSYLDQFPVDLVKLDRRFVTKLGDGEGENRLVRAMIEMADHLQLAATAEGVEAEEHLDWLTAAGCTYAQGFLFGEPVPAADIQ